MQDAQTVLIVDDDHSIRDPLRLLLEDEGYATLEARDGEECLDAVLLSPVRLVVLLDLTMPRMSGLDVLALVASDTELLVRHAFIVMSANADVAARAGPLLLNLDIPMLRKPFSINVLLDHVAQAAQRLSAHPQERNGCAESARG